MCSLVTEVMLLEWERGGRKGGRGRRSEGGKKERKEERESEQVRAKEREIIAKTIQEEAHTVLRRVSGLLALCRLPNDIIHF